MKSGNELFGLGRTWWMAVLLIVVSTLLLVLGKIDGDLFESLIMLAFGGGSLKSMVQKVAENFGKKE